MSEFVTRGGRALQLRRLDKRETKRQVERFLGADRADGWQLTDAFDRLFDYCARGVVDDPPVDAFTDLPDFLQPDDGDGDPDRRRADWLRLVVLGDVQESILLAASVCGLALGYTVKQVRRLQTNLGRQ